jgi:hypothetical protein
MYLKLWITIFAGLKCSCYQTHMTVKWRWSCNGGVVVHLRTPLTLVELCIALVARGVSICIVWTPSVSLCRMLQSVWTHLQTCVVVGLVLVVLLWLSDLWFHMILKRIYWLPICHCSIHWFWTESPLGLCVRLFSHYHSQFTWMAFIFAYIGKKTWNSNRTVDKRGILLNSKQNGLIQMWSDRETYRGLHKSCSSP